MTASRYGRRFFALLVHFGIVCSAENEVHRNIVEVRKADKGLGGDIALAGFVMAVRPLTAIDIFSNLCLCEKLAVP